MEKNSSDSWHGAHHYSHKVHIFLILFLFLTAAVLFWYYFSMKNLKISSENVVPSPLPTVSVEISTEPESGAVFCAQDVKECPDGTFVGRGGPNCEFTCPE